DIIVPHTGYSAVLTPLTSTGFDASGTRFGNNGSWRTVTVADDGTDGGADDAADSAIINAANALGRYQMAAFLVSQYNVAAGNTASNNGIQTAIWQILDPSSYSLASFNADPSDALEHAAVWFNTTSSAARDSYLMNYNIVSDTTMTSCGPVACGGFQEQIASVPAVPEPATLPLAATRITSLIVVVSGKRGSGRARMNGHVLCRFWPVRLSQHRLHNGKP